MRLVQRIPNVDGRDVHQARAGATTAADTAQLVVHIRDVFALAEEAVALALRTLVAEVLAGGDAGRRVLTVNAGRA